MLYSSMSSTQFIDRRPLDRAPNLLFDQMVGPEAILAIAAVNERIGKVRDVTAGLPDARLHQNAAIETNHVAPLLHEKAPPLALNVADEFRAKWAVVPGIGQAAVNIGAGKDKAAPLAERRDGLHAHGLVHQKSSHGGAPRQRRRACQRQHESIPIFLSHARPAYTAGHRGLGDDGHALRAFASKTVARLPPRELLFGGCIGRRRDDAVSNDGQFRPQGVSARLWLLGNGRHLRLVRRAGSHRGNQSRPRSGRHLVRHGSGLRP